MAAKLAGTGLNPAPVPAIPPGLWNYATGTLFAANDRMDTGRGQTTSTAIKWLQEGQQLTWTAASQAMGYYLDGCADIALARTPQQALAALHRMHAGLLTHSAQIVANAVRLWRGE